MMYLYYGLSLITGLILGGVGMAFFITRDKNVVTLKEDEVVIKKPDPNKILIQVTPDIARRMIYEQENPVDLNSKEARHLYPERTKHLLTK